MGEAETIGETEGKRDRGTSVEIRVWGKLDKWRKGKRKNK